MGNAYVKKVGKAINVPNEYVQMVFMEKDVTKYVNALLKIPIRVIRGKEPVIVLQVGMVRRALEHVLCILLAKGVEENVIATTTHNVCLITAHAYVVLVIVDSRVT